MASKGKMAWMRPLVAERAPFGCTLTVRLSQKLHRASLVSVGWAPQGLLKRRQAQRLGRETHFMARRTSSSEATVMSCPASSLYGRAAQSQAWTGAVTSRGTAASSVRV
jgi:hypothetical protein